MTVLTHLLVFVVGVYVGAVTLGLLAMAARNDD